MLIIVPLILLLVPLGKYCMIKDPFTTHDGMVTNFCHLFGLKHWHLSSILKCACLASYTVLNSFRFFNLNFDFRISEIYSLWFFVLLLLCTKGQLAHKFPQIVLWIINQFVKCNLIRCLITYFLQQELTLVVCPVLNSAPLLSSLTSLPSQ